MAAKLTTLTHRIAIQLHLVAEGYIICSSRSRRPVRKLKDTPSFYQIDFTGEVTEESCVKRESFVFCVMPHAAISQVRKYAVFCLSCNATCCQLSWVWFWFIPSFSYIQQTIDKVVNIGPINLVKTNLTTNSSLILSHLFLVFETFCLRDGAR